MNHREIKRQWNKRTDSFNEWDNISLEEQVEFAFKLGSGDEIIFDGDEVWDDSLFENISVDDAEVGKTYWAKWDDCGWTGGHKLMAIGFSDYPFLVSLRGEPDGNNVSRIGIKKR